MAVNKIRIIADEKQRRLRLTSRRAQPSGEMLKGPIAGHVVVMTDRRSGTVWHDAVDADLIFRELHRHGARHVDDAGFGRCVSNAVEPSDHPRGRTEINNLAAVALLSHLLGDVFRYQIGTLQTHRDD